MLLWARKSSKYKVEMSYTETDLVEVKVLEIRSETRNYGLENNDVNPKRQWEKSPIKLQTVTRPLSMEEDLYYEIPGDGWKPWSFDHRKCLHIGKCRKFEG